MRRTTAVLFTLAFAAVLGCSDVEAPYGIKGVQAGGAYAWIVPVRGGVVVVDTGNSSDAQEVKDAIGGQPILGVLITHSHNDHVAGAKALNARTIIGDQDLPTWKGERKHKGLAQRTGFGGDPAPMPDQVEGVADGFIFHAGDDEFEAINLPGHTPGSMAWKFKDVLFGGDAVYGGEQIGTSPFFFSDDDKQAHESLQKLHAYDFTVLLDGHTGRTDDAKSRLPAKTR